MAQHVEGPLYYERMGRRGPAVAFIHPNPMDQSCWLFQMAHFSTWFRCIAIDIPGYGRSPKSAPGMTSADMAQACWEAIDDAMPGERTILVGCSAGSSIALHMFHRRPDKTAAIILSGIGYTPGKEFASRSIAEYRKDGFDYRWRFTFEDFSPAFGASPLATYFATLFAERNDTADIDSIVRQFEAHQRPEPEGHFSGIACPTIILTGTEDGSHPRAFALRDRIPGCELQVLPGAGHACQMEQPWLFDKLAIAFLMRHGLFPDGPRPIL